MTGLIVSVTGFNGAFPVKAHFTADQGVTALFGHSGAGKTTLLKMISGTLRPETGRIAIGDHVLFDKDKGIFLPPEKRRIGYVFQDARLFPNMSVARNLTYAQWAGKRRASRSFDDIVGLLGLEKLLKRKPTHLSGGERQRVAIGRALLSDPALLLLDEPLSSLDRMRRQEILPYLEMLRDESGVPIVYVSHEIDEVARLADTLVLLSAGNVVASGPVEQVFPLIDNQSDGASVLLEGNVTDYDAAYQIATIDLNGTPFQITDQGVSKGMRLRLRIRARDVSISRQKPEGLSIRNILPVKISAINDESGSFALLTLTYSEHQLGARLTRKSVADLSLQVGDDVYAMVKAVSVDRTALR
ncbi:molybdenum ABC transporter ATP-binding protein [Brucellaceae bacterium C25G]